MNKVLCYLSFGVASALCIVGLLLPPQGKIDASVCFTVAQFLIFTASLCGVDAALLKFHKTLAKNIK